MKEKLGAGSFGTVYKAVDMKTKKYVSVKVEVKSNRFPQLTHEAKIVKLMSKIEGFAKHRYYTEDLKHRYLVMTYLGASVDSYLERATKFSLTTVI
jgi:serine/threonine protein kinase